MTPTTFADTDWHGLKVVSETPSEAARTKRIMTALGGTDDRLPFADDEMLVRYYEHLSENLSFPFTAHYPEPRTFREEAQYECTVLELLDPSRHIADEFDGLFCKTRKAGFEVNLPLVELEVPQDARNFQRIEDYWYWFWNWCCR